jgi:hypothetical protein
LWLVVLAVVEVQTYPLQDAAAAGVLEVLELVLLYQ